MLKVFLVEDECVVREGLRECIDWARYGFEFCVDAPDGELALPQIRKLRPDILITDIKMPFMDGLALSKLVCAELPETKIILISGHNDFEFAQEAIEIGVEQYLLKPVTKSSENAGGCQPEDRRGTRAEGLSAPLPAGRAGV